MNADTPIRLSILVPIYGVERYIGDCARSLLSQSVWEGVEFIFVDDASPDRSIEILGQVLTEYPARTPQTHILSHPCNRGLAAARRTAIDAARGEWILHVDSDDILLPGAVARLLEAADVPGDTPDLVFGNYFEADDPIHNKHPRTIRLPHWSRMHLLRTLLTQNYRIANRTWGILIRRTLYTANNIYPIEGINFGEDYAVMPRLLHAARHIRILGEEVYGYRLGNTDSYTKRLDSRAASQYVAANRVVTDYLKQQPDYAALHDCMILGRLNIEKWILKRGLRIEEYDARLFYDGDRPRRWLHRIYAMAIESRSLPLARIAGFWINLIA